MQEQQRFVNFVFYSVMIWLVWVTFVQPRLFPPKPKPQVVQNDAVKALDKDAAKEPEPKNEGKTADDAKDPAGVKNAEKPKAEKLHEFPSRNDVTIGSPKPESGYRLFVKFESKGATLSEIQLIDPRYHDLQKQKEPFRIIGPDPALKVRPLQTEVPAIDVALKKYDKSLKDLDWEVVKGEQDEGSVTWRYVAPDDSIEVRKKFSLEKADPKRPDLEYKAYTVKYSLTLTNLKEKPQKLEYEMFGPVGLPIENRNYTQKTRDIAVGFVTPTGALSPKIITPDALKKEEDNNRVEDWKTPLKYVGTDVQFFSVLLLPTEDQLKTNYFSNARAVFVDDPPKDTKDTKFRNTTVQLRSAELDLAPKGDEDAQATQDFLLYAGPKRADLLRPLGTERIIDYGIAGNLGITQTLLNVLSIFHQGLSFLPWPYGWSIILLTVLVRSCMFPLSRKQALSAAKMQELQPELTALKEKYKNAPEKFARAQMDLFAKHNCNPLSGCLPLLIQLPIFLGLYQAFNISVEMRGAPFMWIDNLAAPDALFKFPFPLWAIGDSFNLLPVLSVCLFLAQQKLMMPPATTPEMEMQHKMFFWMTLFMGYMFYHMAAGMCIYFIASSLWGLAERKLLPKHKTPPAGGAGGTIVVQANKPK